MTESAETSPSLLARLELYLSFREPWLPAAKSVLFLLSVEFIFSLFSRWARPKLSDKRLMVS